MMMNVCVTYDVKEIAYGGQGFRDDVRLINSFETYEEAYACAMAWKDAHPNAFFRHVHIITNYHLPADRDIEL